MKIQATILSPEELDEASFTKEMECQNPHVCLEKVEQSEIRLYLAKKNAKGELAVLELRDYRQSFRH